MDLRNLLVKIKIKHHYSQQIIKCSQTLHALGLVNICIKVCFRNVHKIVATITF